MAINAVLENQQKKEKQIAVISGEYINYYIPNMNPTELQDIIKVGETSRVQFKRELGNQSKVAAEMIAFSNSNGGMLIFGVLDKTGEIAGLSYEELQKANNELATIANELVKPLIYITTEAVIVDTLDGKKNVLVVHVEEGISKPYKDLNGTIWLKQGADKRKVTDNAEILRLLQSGGKFYADKSEVLGTAEKDINASLVSEYVKKIRGDLSDSDIALNRQLFENLGIIKNEKLTLAGLLCFGKNPQKYEPVFCVKAISFFGDSIGGTEYRDSADITGTLQDMFTESIAFFNRNLRHVQAGQNFNSTGILEISKIALEELIQNALLHRDYTINASVRLMIFDNRIEIVSPGRLPNSLSVEKIKMGNAVTRNSLLASYCSKLMNYRGFGSGITRAISNQPNTELINDVEGEQFIVRIPRA